MEIQERTETTITRSIQVGDYAISLEVTEVNGETDTVMLKRDGTGLYILLLHPEEVRAVMLLLESVIARVQPSEFVVVGDCACSLVKPQKASP